MAFEKPVTSCLNRRFVLSRLGELSQRHDAPCEFPRQSIKVATEPELGSQRILERLISVRITGNLLKSRRICRDNGPAIDRFNPRSPITSQKKVQEVIFA